MLAGHHGCVKTSLGNRILQGYNEYALVGTKM